MSQCGSRWASSIITDRRWPGVSPVALWKILYSITPESHGGPACPKHSCVNCPVVMEADGCELTGCCCCFDLTSLMVSGASRAVSKRVPPCFDVHRWPDSSPGWIAATPTVTTSLTLWLNAAAKLLNGFKTSNNIRPILPPLAPADISINCNIWLVLKLCCKPTVT